MHNYNRHASVTTMLQHLHLPTIKQRRQHFKIIMLCRITHRLASIPTATYITSSTPNTQHYILLYARTHVFKTSFFPSTINIWNNLQHVITNSTTIPQLRQALQSTTSSGRRGAPCSAGTEGTPHVYKHHLYVQPNSNTTTKHQPITNTPGITVLMLSCLLPIRWQDHTVVSDHTVSNPSPTTPNHTSKGTISLRHNWIQITTQHLAQDWTVWSKPTWDTE